jgi:hypothetical protein
MTDTILEQKVDQPENVDCVRELKIDELENVAGGHKSIVWTSDLA